MNLLFFFFRVRDCSGARSANKKKSFEKSRNSFFWSEAKAGAANSPTARPEVVPERPYNTYLIKLCHSCNDLTPPTPRLPSLVASIPRTAASAAASVVM